MRSHKHLVRFLLGALSGSLLGGGALLAQPGDAGKSTSNHAPADQADVPAEVPAGEKTEQPRVVTTRFYWPKYGTADVTVEQFENDHTMRYGMELYVTPSGDDEQARAVRLAAHELEALDGIAVTALDEHDTEREVAQFKLRLAPTRYFEPDGSYGGCDNVSELIQANLSVFTASDQLDAVTMRRLQRELTNSATADRLKANARWEMLEWAGFWNGVELAKGKPRTIKRLLPMADGGQVQVDVTYLWQGSLEREGRSYEQIWLRARIKGEAFRKVAAPIIRQSGIALIDSVEGEQVITASIITDPYTLLPVEVTAQYNTVVLAGEVERAHVLARKATFNWEKGKDVLTHAEGEHAESH